MIVSLPFHAIAVKQAARLIQLVVAFNKWLHQYVPENCVIHSFRHSIRDRLRAVECPSDIVDAIGGWKTSGVGHGYGNGYPLNVLEKWMKRIAH